MRKLRIMQIITLKDYGKFLIHEHHRKNIDIPESLTFLFPLFSTLFSSSTSLVLKLTVFFLFRLAVIFFTSDLTSVFFSLG